MQHYAMQLKQTKFHYKKEGYSYDLKISEKLKCNFPTKIENYYYKTFPKIIGKEILIVKVEAKIIDKELLEIKYFTISLQILLTLFFALISFILAHISLRPMKNTISHLDRFIKDLIHDLNTPITSILLNSKMLEKEVNENGQKKLERIKRSADSISSLYKNLDILLENSYQKSKFDLEKLLKEKIEIYKTLYPNITFFNSIEQKMVFSNEKAISRILDNLISNSCKYAKNRDPKIEIIYKKNKLIIKDNGKGIKYPQKVFERSYTENENGFGIGMHIVHRLTNALDMKIKINSKEKEGTEIILEI